MRGATRWAVVGAGLLALAACASSGIADETVLLGASLPNANESVAIDAGTGTGDAVADTQAAFAEAMAVSQTALSTALMAVANTSSVDLTAQACSTSGTYTVTGTGGFSDGHYTYDVSTAYNACNGMNGSLTHVGTYDITAAGYTYHTTSTGSIGGHGCILSFENFGVDQAYDQNTQAFNVTYNGSYTSLCGSDTVVCTFDHALFSDTTAFANSCTLNGVALH